MDHVVLQCTACGHVFRASHLDAACGACGDDVCEVYEIPVKMCIRCGEQEIPRDRDFCSDCTWINHGEVVRGLNELSEYLSKWAMFGEWEVNCE